MKKIYATTTGKVALCILVIALGVTTALFLKNQFSPAASGSFTEAEREEMEEESEEAGKKLQFIEEAWRQEFERTKDPETGTVPKERLLSAFDVALERKAAINRNPGAAMQRSIAGISWQERGPFNVGGRILTLLYDANDPMQKTVFAGAAGGGIWRCNDIAAATPSWIKVSDTYENIAVSTIAQNPTNPQIMYFGTGEGWFNLGAQNGLGIWKSTNGGTTWSHLPSTISSNFVTVQKMEVAANGDVYAATSPAGIMKSSDGGLTWRNVLSGASAADLEIATNGDVYATQGIFSPGRVMKSVAGANVGEAGTWTNITPTSPTGFQRIEIGMATSNPTGLYVVCQGGASNDATDMFHSIDGGTTWIPCGVNTAIVQDPIPTSTNFTRGQAWYDLVCEVDPLNELTVYIGGVDVHKSINGGISFLPLTKWTSLVNPSPAIPVIHADQHALAFRPGTSNEVVFGNDGGVFYSNNINLPSPLYTIPTKDFGLNVTQFYCVGMHPAANSNYFLAGAQDNGSQRFNGGPGVASTTEATGGDGGFCHIDQLAPTTQFTSYVYSSYYRSTNGGTSFSNTINDAAHGQFINPTDYDDVSKVFYSDYTTLATRIGGAYGRWLTSGSTNVGVTVTNFNSASVSHVYVSPNVANRVYFGLANGSIVYVDGANTAVTAVGTVIKTGAGSVSGIAIEKGNEAHLLATYSNYGVPSVWESTDGGANWTNVEGNLPDMPVRWVIFHPTMANQAMIATELGVWSTDLISGSTTEWNPTGNNMPNCRVDMLQVRTSDNVISAATYGRGLFTTTLNNSTVPLVNFGQQTLYTSEDNPTTSLGCGTYGYKDIPVTLYISKAPVGDAVVNISLNPNSTVAAGQDYSLSSNTVTFPSGSTAPKTINIRVFDDHNIEPVEYLELSLSVSGTTDAIKNSINQNYTLEIRDNEVAPSAAFLGKLQVGNFTTNLGGSSPLQGSQSDKKMQFIYLASDLTASGITAGNITGFSFGIGTKGSLLPFMGFTIKMGTTNVSSLAAGFVNNSSFTTVYSAPVNGFTSAAGDNEFTFTAPFVWDGTSNVVFEYCYNNLAAPPAAPVPIALPAGSGDDILKGQTTSYTSQARAATTNVIADNGCAFTTATLLSTFRPLIKLFQLQPQTPVETVLNSTMNYNLGPNETVYFYNPATKKVLSKIENLSSFNYGCINLKIDRQGTGAVPFNNNTITNYLTSKAILFTPQFENPTGAIRYTVYYTAAEKTGYEAATGNLWANAKLIKTKNASITSVTPVNPSAAQSEQSANTQNGMLGADYFITGQFTTGFSGVAAGVLGSVILPLNNITLNGIYTNGTAQLHWNSAGTEPIQSYLLQRSANGVSFTDVYSTAANTAAYNYADKPGIENVFYRVKLTTRSGQTVYSNVVLLKQKKGNAVVISPNPFAGFIQVAFGKTITGPLQLQLMNQLGQVAYSKSYTSFNGQFVTLELGEGKLAKGTYRLVITNNGTKENYAVLKQ